MSVNCKVWCTVYIGVNHVTLSLQVSFHSTRSKCLVNQMEFILGFDGWSHFVYNTYYGPPIQHRTISLVHHPESNHQPCPPITSSLHPKSTSTTEYWENWILTTIKTTDKQTNKEDNYLSHKTMVTTQAISSTHPSLNFTFITSHRHLSQLSPSPNFTSSQILTAKSQLHVKPNLHQISSIHYNTANLTKPQAHPVTSSPKPTRVHSPSVVKSMHPD